MSVILLSAIAIAADNRHWSLEFDCRDRLIPPLGCMGVLWPQGGFAPGEAVHLTQEQAEALR